MKALEWPICVRTPALPARVAFECQANDTERAAVLTALGEDEFLLDRLRLASKSVARALADIERGAEPRNKRAYLSILNYVIRMSSRSTPFGAFASVGILDGQRRPPRFEQTFLDTRLDMEALEDIVAGVEREPFTFAQMKYYCNPLNRVRGNRLFVTDSTKGIWDADGRLSPARNSLRYTTLVARALEMARDGVGLSTLAETLAQEFHLDADRARQTIVRLIEGGVIFSELRCALTEDPSLKTMQRLAELDPSSHGALLEQLLVLQERPLNKSTFERIAEVERGIQPLVASDRKHLVQVDSFREFTGSLPPDILSDVGVLAELSLRFGKVVRLEAYKNRAGRWLERVGEWTPLLDLVDPEWGVGAPDTSEISPTGRSSEYELWLDRTVLPAALNREETVMVDLDELRTLLPLPRRDNLGDGMEIGFEVIARDFTAISDGNYRVGFAGFTLSSAPFKSLGRFMYLNPHISDRVRALLPHDPSVIHAELVYQPTVARLGNVSSRPGLYPFEVRVSGSSAAARGDIIPVADLLVSLQYDRFVIWSKSHRKEVRVHESHMLNLVQAPAMARFLAFTAMDGKVSPSTFDFAQLRSLPYLPRICADNIVLSSAQWQFRVDIIRSGLTNWEPFQATWRIPRFVTFAENDRRLLLDLQSSIGRALLTDALRKKRPVDYVTLHEVLQDRNQLFLRDKNGERYFSECIANVLFDPAVDDQPAIPPLAEDCARLSYPPGSEWCYLKLYCARSHMDDVVKSLMPDLLSIARLRGILAWHFLRYSDQSGSHLRFRVKSAESNELLCALLTRLRESTEGDYLSKVNVDTYDPEVERYGGLKSYVWCEDFFTASSQQALSTLSGSQLLQQEKILEAAGWLVRVLGAVEAQNARLLEGWDKIVVRRPLTSYDRTLAVEAEKKGLKWNPDTHYRGDAELAFQNLCTPLSPDSSARMWGSLIHLHCNRLGIDPQGEGGVSTLIRRARERYRCEKI